jgi:GntR family transcriptional regulator
MSYIRQKTLESFGDLGLNNGMDQSSLRTPNALPRFNPLYLQVKEALLARLGNGEWQPGTVLPSEIQLAEQFEVSQGTVRKAIDSLAMENIVVRRQGRGTYVATHAETVAQFRFLKIRPDQGDAMQPESKILSCDRVRAPAEVAVALKLRPAEQAYLIRRLLSFDGQPIVLDVIWVPAQRFRGLSQERLSQYKGPLYGLFETEFKTRMIRCEERLRALPAEATVALALSIEIAEPVLVVERVSYSYDDEAVEVRLGYCVTKNFHYANELS